MTSAVVAMPNHYGWQGRMVFYDGNPAHTGVQLLEIIRRDSPGYALHTLVGEHTYWVMLAARYSGGVSDKESGEGKYEVPMYGIAANRDWWVNSLEDPCVNWAYVIGDTELRVLEAQEDAEGVWRWVQRAAVSYQDARAEALLEGIEPTYAI